MPCEHGLIGVEGEGAGDVWVSDRAPPISKVVSQRPTQVGTGHPQPSAVRAEGYGVSRFTMAPPGNDNRPGCVPSCRRDDDPDSVRSSTM